METLTGIERAVRIAGGQTELARKLGVTSQAVQKWCQAGYAPPKRALQIEMILQNEVTRYDLNPEIYPRTIFPQNAPA